MASEGSATAQAPDGSVIVDRGHAGSDDASTAVSPGQVSADPAGSEAGAPQPGEPGSGPALGSAPAPGPAAQPPGTAADPARPGEDPSRPVDGQGSSPADLGAPSASPEPVAPVRRTLRPVSPEHTAGAGSRALDDATATADASEQRRVEERTTSPGIEALGDPAGLAALLTSVTPADGVSAATHAGDERLPRPVQAGAQRRIPAQPMTPDGDIERSSASGNGPGSAGGGHSIFCDSSASASLATAGSCILRSASVTAWQLLRDRRGQPHPD